MDFFLSSNKLNSWCNGTASCEFARCLHNLKSLFLFCFILNANAPKSISIMTICLINFIWTFSLAIKKFKTFLLHTHVLCDFHKTKKKFNCVEAASTAPTWIYVRQIKQFDMLKYTLEVQKKVATPPTILLLIGKLILPYRRSHAMECHSQQQK